jgi:hypothetical protein
MSKLSHVLQSVTRGALREHPANGGTRLGAEIAVLGGTWREFDRDCAAVSRTATITMSITAIQRMLGRLARTICYASRRVL